ncbi:MAG: homoserine kinase [Candidatus Saccharibacteria bacterium]
MIKIRVPATSANLGPGFDTLGLALPLFLDLKIESTGEDIKVHFSGEGGHSIPVDAGDNLVVSTITATLEKLGYRPGGLHIEINNSIPLARGLGSSAAAIMAGVLAANELAHNPLDEQEILNLATSLEGHPDNIVPALVGGFTISLTEGNKVYYRRLEPPEVLDVVVAIPDFELHTEAARAVRPKEYISQDVVYNLQRACFLVASLASGKLDNLEMAMGDMVHQPYRQSLIPGFGDVIKEALANGALGVALSGAGPSILALTMGSCAPVGKAMQEAFAHHGVAARIFTGHPCREGAVVERE